MAAKIRVAFCTDGVYPDSMGGMQKHSRLLCEELSNYKDLDLFVIHPHEGKELFPGSGINEVAIKAIDTERNYLLESYRYSKRVYAALEEINPDIIYSQGLCIWYKAGSVRKKLIINPHGLEPYQALGWRNKLAGIPFRLLFNHLFSKAAVVVSLGGKLTTILSRVIKNPSKIVELPNGVNLPPATAVSTGHKPVLTGLFLARFAHNKGIDILFEAIEHYSKKPGGSPFRFLLGGKGPLYEFYRNKTNYNNAQLLGFVRDEDIPGLYQQADFFVFPTLFEGMPTVVLEAMSFGLPVIVSDVGATRVLVDDSNGKVINPGSAQELIAALDWFAGLSEEKRSTLSHASRNRVASSFTWDQVASRHHALFTTMTREKN